MLKTYRDLVAWQKAFALCALVYRLTRAFPRSELYGLTGQLRRAAVSIPSNIAEGFGRRATADFPRSLYIAYDSVCELATQAEISLALGYLDEKSVAGLLGAIGDVERLTKALIRSLERKRAPA